MLYTTNSTRRQQFNIKSKSVHSINRIVFFSENKLKIGTPASVFSLNTVLSPSGEVLQHGDVGLNLNNKSGFSKKNIKYSGYNISSLGLSHYRNFSSVGKNFNDIENKKTITEQEIKENNQFIRSQLLCHTYKADNIIAKLQEVKTIIKKQDITKEEKQKNIEGIKTGVKKNYSSIAYNSFLYKKYKFLSEFVSKYFKRHAGFKEYMINNQSISYSKNQIDLPDDLVTNEKRLFFILISTINRNNFFINNEISKAQKANYVIEVTFVNAFVREFFKIFEPQLKMYACITYVKQDLLHFINSNITVRDKRQMATKRLEQFIGSIKKVVEPDNKISAEDFLSFSTLESFSFNFLSKSKLSEYADAVEFLDDIYIFIFDSSGVIETSKAYNAFINNFNNLWEVGLENKNELAIKYEGTLAYIAKCYLSTYIIQDQPYYDNLSTSTGDSFVIYRARFSGKNHPIIGLYMLNDHLIHQIISVSYASTNLPMLCKPINWNITKMGKSKNNGGYLSNKELKHNKLMVSSVQGVSAIKFSRSTVGALNILQGYRFITNTFFMKVLKDDRALSYLELISVEKLNEIIKEHNKKVNNFIRSLNNKHIRFAKYQKELPTLIHLFKSRTKDKENIAEKYKLIMELEEKYGKSTHQSSSFEEFMVLVRKEYNIMDEAIEKTYKELLDTKQFIVKQKNGYMFHDMNIKIAETYSGHTYYFPSFFCFRLRNYVASPYCSRNSGIYKYLSNSKVKEPLSERGLYWIKLVILDLLGFKKSTISEYECLFEPIYSLLIENYSDKDPFHILDIFKKEYPENKIDGKNHLIVLIYIHELYLHHKDNNYKSNIILPIDQVASGPQILSILANCRKTLSLTNITSGGYKNDIYLDFIQLCISLFKEYTSKNTTYSIFNEPRLQEKLLSLLTRSFAKKFVMPKFYGMGAKGVKNIIEQEMDLNTNTELQLIELQYPYFNVFLFKQIIFIIVMKALSKSYKILDEYFKYLTGFIRILEKHKLPVRFSTLDHSLITYKYCKSSIITRKLITPDKPLTFSQYIINPEEYAKNNTSSIVPHFIQAVDGAICRLVIRKIYNDQKIHIQPIHDSFGCHPNHIDVLKMCINDIYKKELLEKNSTLIFNSFIDIEDYDKNSSVYKELLEHYNQYEENKNKEIELGNTDYMSNKEMLTHFEDVIFNFFV